MIRFPVPEMSMSFVRHLPDRLVLLKICALLLPVRLGASASVEFGHFRMTAERSNRIAEGFSP
jgi:hypothetical protein